MSSIFWHEETKDDRMRRVEERTKLLQKRRNRKANKQARKSRKKVDVC